MKKSVVYGLITVMFLGAFTNLWRLGAIPPGLHADEAMIGYTTLSLLKTGKDLFGLTNYLALTDPNAGGTYPPLRSYILMPFVSLMGLSIVVNRLPPAIFGIIAIFAVFRISRFLWKDDATALIAAFIMAINPWATQIARQGLLESAALTIVICGVWAFLEAEKKPILYGLSGLLFGLSLFAYDAPRLFLPPFLLLLVWYRWEHVRRGIRPMFAGMGVFGVFIVLLLYQVVFRGEAREYSRTSLFGSDNVKNAVIRGRTMTLAPSWAANIVHNKVTETVRLITTNYVSIFSVNWFFINGYGNLQEAVGNHGQFMVFELPFFFLGWYTLFRLKKRMGWFLLGWMTLGALPGGLSSGNFAYRSVMLLPVPILVSSIGAGAYLGYVSRMKKYMRTAVHVGVCLIVAVCTSSYMYTYFFDYPVYASEAWALQQNDAVRYAAAHKDEYAHVFIDGGASWMGTYGFLYTLDPGEFQQNVHRYVSVGRGQYAMFGGVYFGNLTDDIRRLPSTTEYFPKDSLVITIGPDNVFPRDIPIRRFLSPDGSHSVYKAIAVP